MPDDIATATPNTGTHIGAPVDRVDGPAKVTGAARYAAEYPEAGMVYGFVVSSAIAKGRIVRIDTGAARAIAGVLEIFTHENRPAIAGDREYADMIAPSGRPFRPLEDAEIKWSGQPVALVVAESFELARYAAALVRVEYECAAHATDLQAKRAEAQAPGKDDTAPKSRGNADSALATAEVRHEGEYSLPYEHHNPMEMHGSTVIWKGKGTLGIYDKIQGPLTTHEFVCKVFALREDDVHVMSHYVGGAFGVGLRPAYQVYLAVMAALVLERSVRVTLTRQQMFSLGYRPHTLQNIELGARADGSLTAFRHDAVASTSRFENFVENVVNWSGALYHCDNAAYSHKLVPLDLYTPQDMRAPGGATGMYAIESAMDELAVAAGLDPLTLRLKNLSTRDENEGTPFSSKELAECFRQGAERFGWDRRNPEPRSMRDGKSLVGWGVATGIWEAFYQKASAKAVLTADGKLEVCSATCDIGTGTYTIMTQVAAETLGLPLSQVNFRLGDSTFPEAPIEGGSWTAASVGSAVKLACEQIARKLLRYAKRIKDSPLADAQVDDLVFADGRMALRSDRSSSVSIAEAMQRAGVERIEEEATATPVKRVRGKYACYTHSAIFAEVKVDEDFGSVHVTRVVSAVAAGRILNAKTGKSQVMGGVVWGMGMALHEESLLDHKLGRFMNHSYAEYHVPVNADVGSIDVIFVDERDAIVNPLGVKGLGEIGIVGTAAAIANAVFHATGKRVRELPITLDKLLG